MASIMRWSARREAVREILAGGACVHPGSVFDPIAARGVRAGPQGHPPLMAAGPAVPDTLKAPCAGATPQELAGVASAETMKRATRDADYRCWMTQFLGGH